MDNLDINDPDYKEYQDYLEYLGHTSPKEGDSGVGGLVKDAIGAYAGKIAGGAKAATFGMLDAPKMLGLDKTNPMSSTLGEIKGDVAMAALPLSQASGPIARGAGSTLQKVVDAARASKTPLDTAERLAQWLKGVGTVAGDSAAVEAPMASQSLSRIIKDSPSQAVNRLANKNWKFPVR